MNAAHKIVVLVGSIFLAVGVFVEIIFAIVAEPGKFPLAMLSLPGGFLLIGGGMDIVVAILVHNKKMIVKKGVKYPAKIYGYTENTSVKVNNTYMMDTIVHYFDSYHVEREAIIPTGFTRGAGMYPIGLTIDIFEYNGKYGYDPDSVRDERLPGEEELMDDKPVAPDKLRLVAVRCPNCGSSFRAATGYSSKCPYCGNYLNVNM